MASDIPFGLRFEESPVSSYDNDLQPVYDHLAGLSFVMAADGQKVPFVTFAFNSMGLTNTGTSTKAQEDSEDTDIVDDDYKPKGTGTNTVTEQREVTDRDFANE